MSRTINLYSMKVDKRYLTKAKTLISSLTNCHFIDETDIVNPTLKLSSFDASTTNYIEIPSLNRFYYVTNVTYSKGYYYVSLHVDVLMSFRQAILKQRCIIKRGSTNPSLYMHDDKFETQQYTCDRYLPFVGGGFDFSIQNYILTVMGTGGDTPEDDSINVTITGGTVNTNTTGGITHDDVRE